MLNCAGCFRHRASGEIVQCFVKFSCRSHAPSFEQFALAMTDSNFEYFAATHLNLVVYKLPPYPSDAEELVHFFGKVLPSEAARFRKRFNQVIYLEPLAVSYKLSNFAIDIRELRPVTSIWCMEEEVAKKSPEIAWLQAALIGDLDHCIPNNLRRVISNINFRVGSRETLTP